jgi:hypothetical protein
MMNSQKFCIFLAAFLLIPLITACTPQVTPPAEPTSMPTDTATPIPSATFTLTPSPTTTFTPVPNGPCDNPLLPLVTGNQWSYTVTGGREVYPYTLIVGEREDIGNININVEMIDPSHNRDVKELVVCREGAIDNFPLHVMSMLLSDYLNGVLNTYKESGVYAPSYQDLAGNDWIYLWKSRYLVEEPISIQDPSGGGALYLRLNDPIDVSFQTEGVYEPVTVQAGSYPRALKVTSDYNMAVTVAIGSIITSGDLAIHTEQWYVPYIGLVRARADSAAVSITAGIPPAMSIQSTLELTGFTAGK